MSSHIYSPRSTRSAEIPERSPLRAPGATYLGIAGIMTLVGIGVAVHLKTHKAFDPQESIENISDSDVEKIRAIVEKDADLCMKGIWFGPSSLHSDLQPIIGKTADTVSATCAKIENAPSDVCPNNVYEFSFGTRKGHDIYTTTDGKGFDFNE